MDAPNAFALIIQFISITFPKFTGRRAPFLADPALGSTKILSLYISVANVYKYCTINVYEIRVGQGKERRSRTKEKKIYEKKTFS